jgi:hypothetical protein
LAKRRTRWRPRNPDPPKTVIKPLAMTASCSHLADSVPFVY